MMAQELCGVGSHPEWPGRFFSPKQGAEEKFSEKEDVGNGEGQIPTRSREDSASEDLLIEDSASEDLS